VYARKKAVIRYMTYFKARTVHHEVAENTPVDVTHIWFHPSRSNDRITFDNLPGINQDVRNDIRFLPELFNESLAQLGLSYWTGDQWRFKLEKEISERLPSLVAQAHHFTTLI
jgi:hypothetical protein